MRLLYLDLDTLRPDHLGCYGYRRETSPNIDALARVGIRFDQVYASDSPCLPSRSALFSGRFGVRTGIVNHGGRRADPFASEPSRGRRSEWFAMSWPYLLRQAGLWCTTISTFAERHSAFQWYAGFNEVLNLGTEGHERADQIAPLAVDWLRRKGREENWFLHVHLWDAHAPYRTPEGYGNPFAGQPAPEWIDEEVLAHHWNLAGPHSAQEVMGFGPIPAVAQFPRQPQAIKTASDVHRMFDGYDVGIRYADQHVGRILDCLEGLGVADETVVLVSSDHGENLGELGIYCDHQTADLHTHRLPAVLRFPGCREGTVDGALRYQVDLAATVAELAGSHVPDLWDGRSFAGEGAIGPGRDHLILSCAAWCVQRAVRWDHWIYIRTYHDAFHDFPEAMLFDIEADPHEQHDLASSRRGVAGSAAEKLVSWETEAMRLSPAGADPFWTVMSEGGGWYARGRLEPYLKRLEATGRPEAARRVAAKALPHPALPDMA